MPRYAHLPPSSPPYLELAAFSPDSVIAVLSSLPPNTVSRIELCNGPPSAGGWTPPLASLFELRQYLTSNYSTLSSIAPAVNVMIRPESSSAQFTITSKEFERMKLEVKACAGLADGFVFGILEEEDEATGDDRKPLRIDERRNRELVELAGGKPCTFHRAFDLLIRPLNEPTDNDRLWEDVQHDADVLVRCGFASVLTCGVAGGTAVQGASDGALQMVLRAGREKGLEVIIGGGLRSENVERIAGATRGQGHKWWHSSCITNPNQEDADVEEVEKLKQDLKKSYESMSGGV